MSTGKTYGVPEPHDLNTVPRVESPDRDFRATATRMRSRLATIPLVGSNPTHPEPGK